MRMALVAALRVVAPAVHAQQKEMLKVPGTVPGMPFSPAVRVGDEIYLSGSIGAPLHGRDRTMTP